MTSGGSIALKANVVIARQGSTIDLSGGSLQYLPGYLKSTLLVDASGQRVSIEQAQKGVAYVGIDGDFVVNHSRWGVTETYASALSRAVSQYEPGYEQGGSAGTLTIGTNTPSWYAPLAATTDPYPQKPSATGFVRILDGSIVATTVVGPYQRELPSSTVDPTDLTQSWRYQPKGASLGLTESGDVSFASAVSPLLGEDFGPQSAIPSSAPKYELTLPSVWFGGTFKSISIASGSDPNRYATGSDPTADSNGTVERAQGGHLVIPAGVAVDMGEGGSFSFSGKEADIEGTLAAPGGSVSLTALQKDGASTASTGIHLGASAVIDVAGRFTNDNLDGTNQPYQALNGGNVSLTGAEVVLDEGSIVDVSGGARLNATGTTLTAGKGGAIRINVSSYPTPIGDPTQLTEPYPGKLLLGGDLRGYALPPAQDGLPSRGGSLSISMGSDVVIGSTASPPDGFAESFFKKGGFSSYSIVGGLGLEVASNAVIAPSAEVFTLPAGTAAKLSSGTKLYDVASRGLAGNYSTSLTLSTFYSAPGNSNPANHDLTVDAGATISMVPGSTLRLAAGGGSIFLGKDTDTRPTTIEAEGGTIAVSGASIELAGDASILARGYLQTTLGANNVLVRTVEAGGNVSLTATSSVSVSPTAVVDVSGVSRMADLPLAGGTGSQYQARNVDGDAGTISITAPAGFVAGTFKLGHGSGATGGSSLSIASTGPNGLSVVQNGSPLAGSLAVTADSIDSSSADAVTLSAISASSTAIFDNTNAIEFVGDVTLESSRSLTLLAPILGTPQSGPDSTVKLKSAYVSLGVPYTPEAQNLGSLTSTGTTGHLDVEADVLDVSGVLSLSGTSAYGGFATARFQAKGDIRLSNPSGNLGSPGIFSTGSLEFDCAQLYVASRVQAATAGSASIGRSADNPGFVVEAGSSITITSNGNSAPVPLSFGEKLTFEAQDIVQAGVVRAPQGQIQFLGSHSVTLEDGSLTSASLEGAIVPFGPVQAGGVFGLGANGYSQAGQSPTKSVTLDAPTVAVKKGATIDVSGGGDLLGYLFTPGNGGSNDILDSGYAILPSLGSGPSPLGGTAALSDSSLLPRQSVYLKGVPGLPDGYYTLLPGHYALLPGAYFVQSTGSSYASAPATVTRADGAVVASGYATYGSDAVANPVWNKFVVMPRSVFGKYSELDTYSFNSVATLLASDQGLSVRVPNDAGDATVLATTSLSLEGTGRFQPGSGGVLGDLDIAAPKIAVLGGGATAPDSSYVTIDVQALEGFGAGSILLGGVRTASSSGTVVTVSATQVVVDTNGATWTAPEIILAAKVDPSSPNSVLIKDGSSLHAAVQSGGGSPVAFDTSTLILGTSSDPSSADGALVRLSAGKRVGIVRTSPSGTGTLDVGNASLSAEGSLTLDGSKTVQLGGSAILSASQLDLASKVVNLGAAPAGTSGTTLSTGTIARLASSSNLLIRGYDSIQILGTLRSAVETQRPGWRALRSSPSTPPSCRAARIRAASRRPPQSPQASSRFAILAWHKGLP